MEQSPPQTEGEKWVAFLSDARVQRILFDALSQPRKMPQEPPKTWSELLEDQRVQAFLAKVMHVE